MVQNFGVFSKNGVPSLLELSLSGNKKISTVDQLKELANFKTLMRLDLEGCGVTNEENYRKKLFTLCSTLACIDSLDSQGNEVPGKLQGKIRFFGVA